MSAFRPVKLGVAVLVAVVSWRATRAAAGEPMRYVYAGPESAQDRRHEYRLAILRAALERTRDGLGDYTLTAAEAPPMQQDRQVEELRRPGGGLTVVCRGVSPEMERDLIPVRIPIDRGLTGYRIFVIRRGDDARFESARTIDDLRRFAYGVEESWFEGEILEAAGFRVVTGSEFEGLFHMLLNRRFDAFPRPVTVALEEYGARRTQLPGLAIERGVVLHYPMPLYFWFARTAEGERLAARVGEGLTKMVEDGTFERMFFAHFGRRIADLDLKNRRLFRIHNPLLGQAVPLGDKRLWFDPTLDPVPTEALAPIPNKGAPKQVRR